jgi:hypothetical protein
VLSGSSLVAEKPLPSVLTSAAKAGTENKPVIAALKRCATQNQALPTSRQPTSGQQEKP